MVSYASPGQTLSFSASFKKQKGKPIVGSSPARYSIQDDSGTVILSGVGSQSLGDTSLWTATVTIPSSAPVPMDGSKWKIVWRLPVASGNDAYYTESFPVVQSGDGAVESRPTDVITLANTPFSDFIDLPASVVTPPTYSIVDDRNRKLQTLTPTASDSALGSAYSLWTVSSEGLPPISTNAGYATGVWSWTDPAARASQSELHPIYVLGQAVYAGLNNLRKLVDRLCLQDIHPRLSITEQDLLHFYNAGLSYANTFGEITTGWTLNCLPLGLTSLIEMAAAMHLLRAQFLAEGMSKFDFQGLGVQLNVDRSSTIDTMINWLQSEMEKLGPAKKAWINAGQPTVDSAGLQTTKSRPIASLAINPPSLSSQNFRYNFPQFGNMSRGSPIPSSLVHDTVWLNNLLIGSNRTM